MRVDYRLQAFTELDIHEGYTTDYQVNPALRLPARR